MLLLKLSKVIIIGLDLQLLPIFSRMEDSIWYSHSVLELQRKIELFEKILEVEKKVGSFIPPNFDSYVSREKGKDSHYGETTYTPYGDPVKYITVKDLLQFEYHEEVVDHFVNRAIWAYLRELPEKTKIALFWH